MTFSDDFILEFLEDTGLALPPRAIEYNLSSRKGRDVSYRTVNRRVAKLEKAGLLHKEYKKGGYYSITDEGREYLAGDRKNIPEPREE